MSVSQELPKDKLEDTDQEVEVTFDAQESREIEERRPPLNTDSILDTFKRFMAQSKEELRKHTEDLRKDPDNKHQYQALITQDHRYIQTMEDSISRLLGDRS